MKVCIEGWRGINHSYSIVNQWQLLNLINKNILLRHRDVSYDSNWNTEKNHNGFSEIQNNIIENVTEKQNENIEYDIIYRISFPYNLLPIKRGKLFIYGTSELLFINKTMFCNGDIAKLDEITRIIVPSNWSKQGFINSKVREEKIIVLSHGIDPKTFYLVENTERERFRNNFKINKDDFAILSLGAMTRNKGVDKLLISYFLLKKKYKNLKLILKDQSNLYHLTAGHLIKELFFTKYKNYISDEALAGISIISENLNLTKLHQLYTAADLYVSPYRAEGFNLPPLEAAASGTSILVTKGGSTDDYFSLTMGAQIESSLSFSGFEDNSGPWMDKEKYLEPNQESLNTEIEKSLHTKKNHFKTMESVKFIHTNFNWDIICNKLINIFEKN